MSYQVSLSDSEWVSTQLRYAQNWALLNSEEGKGFMTTGAFHYTHVVECIPWAAIPIPNIPTFIFIEKKSEKIFFILQKIPPIYWMILIYISHK